MTEDVLEKPQDGLNEMVKKVAILLNNEMDRVAEVFFKSGYEAGLKDAKGQGEK